MQPTKLITKIGALAALTIAFAISASAADIAGKPEPRPPAPFTAPPTFNSDLYKAEKLLLDSTDQVDEDARYRIRIEAVGDIDQVRVLENLPDGLAFVDAQPAPTETSGASYLWTWSNMPRGTTKEIIVTVRPKDGGWFVTNTKVAVVPMLGLPIFAGRPKLELTKTGPAQAELNDDISYRLTVSNVGNAAARDVVVTDTLPAGLYSQDRTTNVVTHRIGTLAAGETRIIDIPARAAVKGEWDNRANAYSSHLVQANASVHTSIVESKVKLTKTGPTNAFVFSTVSYAISMTNEGDTILENIQLTDAIPEGTRLAGATDNGEASSGRVSWIIPRLAPGESTRRDVQITGQKVQTTNASATARLSTGRVTNAAVATEWEGAPGILTEIADDADPVSVGAKVTYTVKITNQSPMRDFASDAVFVLTPNMRFVETTKNVKPEVNAQNLLIRNIALKPRASITFKIIAQPTESGIGGIRFEYGGGVLPRPVVKEESTYVY